MADASTSIPVADVLAIDAQVLATTGTPNFGVTDAGFLAKPFARLLAEKLALARALIGDEVDLTSGSVVRKLLELILLPRDRTREQDQRGGTDQRQESDCDENEHLPRLARAARSGQNSILSTDCESNVIAAGRPSR